MKKGNTSFLFFFATIICFSFLYSFSYGETTPTVNVADRFPYRINFTPAELKLLNSLDEATIKKLVAIAQMLVKKNTASNTSNNASSSIATNQNQAQALIQGFPNVYQQPKPNLPISANSPFTSGQREAPDENGYTRSDYAAAASSAQQFQTQIGPPIDPVQVDFSKLPPDTNGTCSQFGVQGNIGNVSSKLKFDMACICRAFGGKNLTHEGTTRSGACHSGDQHSCGKAIDIKTNQFGDKSKNAMLITVLIALGYNIGSYQSGFTSFHADHENAGKWKTWSGVAHTNYAGSNQRPYIEEVRDALLMIGRPANSSAEFRMTYGNYAKNSMMQAAANVVNEKGNDAMKQCIKNTLNY